MAPHDVSLSSGAKQRDARASGGTAPAQHPALAAHQTARVLSTAKQHLDFLNNTPVMLGIVKKRIVACTFLNTKKFGVYPSLQSWLSYNNSSHLFVICISGATTDPLQQAKRSQLTPLRWISICSPKRPHWEISMLRQGAESHPA